jgi:superfamily II DNA helicase RecQ
LDRQAGHGRRVAQAHYAIDGAFLHRLGPELITAFEQASIAWHHFFEWPSKGANPRESVLKATGHRREASQQLQPSNIKRECHKGTQIAQKALDGLRYIYGPTAQPRSEGQAAALELVHNPPKTSIIVLPTSSGKSVLFFSVAAMTIHQTVIVVVPFATLVDDIVDRACKARLQCQEWKDEKSMNGLPQLIIVSADRAVTGEFLQYAKGLDLERQLAYVFFDECHVAFIDTSYRARLRELWKLRRLENCPFTCLTATLMVDLEWTLREQLLIENAILFRRSTARPTIQYTVHDSGDEPPSEVGIRVIQQLIKLPVGKRGVVYVKSYTTGEMISKELMCPFYKASADDKGQILQEWINGFGGWIVATGALGTGINIEGIIIVIHIDRPYGLVSFIQQSGRGGRNGEVSESIIIVRVKKTHGWKQKEILSDYTVEKVDEEAMTEFIQSKECRRIVLSKRFDGDFKDIDCINTDSVLCDRCIRVARRVVIEEAIDNNSRDKDDKDNKDSQREGVTRKINTKTEAETEAKAEAEVEVETEEAEIQEEESGNVAIRRKLQGIEEANENMMKAMDRLQRRCIYCELIHTDRHQMEAHEYVDCKEAKHTSCDIGEYKQWRKGIDMRRLKHCWECGLSQRICRRLEGIGENRERSCEYGNVMLVGIFILDQREGLQGIIQQVGYQGDYGKDIWQWMNEEREGWGLEWESNWMITWRHVCRKYIKYIEDHCN